MLLLQKIAFNNNNSNKQLPFLSLLFLGLNDVTIRLSFFSLVVVVHFVFLISLLFTNVKRVVRSLIRTCKYHNELQLQLKQQQQQQRTTNNNPWMKAQTLGN